MLLKKMLKKYYVARPQNSYTCTGTGCTAQAELGFELQGDGFKGLQSSIFHT